jgi:hypothetical protein
MMVATGADQQRPHPVGKGWFAVTVPPQDASEVSIGELAKDASTHLSTIIRGEVELAKSEISGSVKNAGTGIVMFIAAGVVLVFSLTFGLIALAEGLITLGIWRWAAFLIVFGFLVLLALFFAFLGVRKVKRVKAPARTIATTKETAAFLKHPTKA